MTTYNELRKANQERKTYKVICRTYHNSARYDFKRVDGCNVAIIEEGITLEDANKLLMEICQEHCDYYMPNWGLMVANPNDNVQGIGTHEDGTRFFDTDGYVFSVEPEFEEVIAYKQGSEWVVNVGGYVKQMHYSIKTRKDVLAHFEEANDNYAGVPYIVKFAK